jgi:hypothetical protein
MGQRPVDAEVARLKALAAACREVGIVQYQSGDLSFVLGGDPGSPDVTFESDNRDDSALLYAAVPSNFDRGMR